MESEPLGIVLQPFRFFYLSYTESGEVVDDECDWRQRL